MAITSFTPTTGYARHSTLMYPTITPTTITLTTGGGVGTLTAAQLLNGLLRVDTQDAQSLNFPTAAAIVAAINGCQPFTAFEVSIINYGDAILTLVLGTGITSPTITTKTIVLTMATFAAKRFMFVVTSITPGAEAVSVYGFGDTAAAVA